jgi:hypothetical protein
MNAAVSVFDRLSEARDDIIRAAVSLASADAHMRFTIDASNRAGRPSDDLKVLLSEVRAQLDIANESLGVMRRKLAEVETGSLG